MSEVVLSDKGLEAFHSAIVESKKVVDTMSAARQAFSRMADSVAEYAAMLDLDQVQAMDRQLQVCTERVTAAAGEVRAAASEMQALAASTRQSFDIEELCQKSADEWASLQTKISGAGEALQKAGEEAGALNAGIASALEMIQTARKEMEQMVTQSLSLQTGVREDIQALKAEAAAAKAEAAAVNSLYREMIGEIKISRELFAELGRQKTELAAEQAAETKTLENLMLSYQKLLGEQQRADAAAAQTRRAGEKKLQELLELSDLVDREQETVGARLQSLLAEARGVRQDTAALAELAGKINLPDDQTLVRAYEGFFQWLKNNPAQRKDFLARLKDMF